jgi:hypothetical protein
MNLWAKIPGKGPVKVLVAFAIAGAIIWAITNPRDTGHLVYVFATEWVPAAFDWLSSFGDGATSPT